MRASGLVLSVFLLLMAGCHGCMEPPPEEPPPTPTNIIVILDISDRVSKAKHPNQAQKDIQIAKAVRAVFGQRVKQSGYTQTFDRLTFAVPKQPNTESIPATLIDGLKIWSTDESRDRGSPGYTAKRAELIQAVDELYQFVETRNEFTGSDIWDWFRSSAKGYLEQGMDNYIICVTDGYLDFDANIQHDRIVKGKKKSYIPYEQVVAFRKDLNNWEQVFDTEGHGLLEIGKDFSAFNVKFLMAEMELRHMGDYEILVKYWDSWLQSMGITDTQFERTGSGTLAIVETIRKFIPIKTSPPMP